MKDVPDRRAGPRHFNFVLDLLLMREGLLEGVLYGAVIAGPCNVADPCGGVDAPLLGSPRRLPTFRSAPVATGVSLHFL